MVNVAFAIPRRELEEFCRRRHIRWLALFGSVLTDRLRADSDVDVLVEFEPGHTPGLAIVDVEEISTLFGGRKVDLILRPDLNRWIRNKVLAEAEVLYGEG
ncbi:MAG: nucleotidyltransferase domain-containing protein [Chloroflexota bacterium]|nr:nucleotidyltransferase domain-containing protein [Chloroflexota bacterium]